MYFQGVVDGGFLPHVKKPVGAGVRFQQLQLGRVACFSLKLGSRRAVSIARTNCVD